MRLGLSFTTAGSWLSPWPIGVPEKTRSETRPRKALPQGSGLGVATHPVAQLSFRIIPTAKTLQQPHRPRPSRALYFHTIYDAAGKLIGEYSTVVASANDAKVSYLTNDHLGSPRVTTDATGQVLSRRDFMPFGEEIPRSNYGSDSTRQKFTGYERDTETGLDFAQARYNSSNLGRFSSPDPMGGGRIQPQSLNRYSYVLNNPLNLVDPTGLECSEANQSGPSDRCIWVSNGEGRYESMWKSSFKKGNDLFDKGFSIIDFREVQPFVLKYIGNNSANPNNTTNLAGLKGKLVTLADDGQFSVFDPDDIIRVDATDDGNMLHHGSQSNSVQIGIGPFSGSYSRDYTNGVPGQEYLGLQIGPSIPPLSVSIISSPGTTSTGIAGNAQACAILCGSVGSPLLNSDGLQFSPAPGFGFGSPQAGAGAGVTLPMSRSGNTYSGPRSIYHPGYYCGNIPY